MKVRGNKRERTDWNSYYRKKSIFSVYAQWLQRRYIVDMLAKYVDRNRIKNVVELGGAASSFYKTIQTLFQLETFGVVDNSTTGLEAFQKMYEGKELPINICNHNILEGNPAIKKCDMSYSLGLIEHFDPAGTKKAIIAHFDCVENGGYVMVSFPTPTKQYKIIRKCMELLGKWQFWDERPLLGSEVEDAVGKYGKLICKRLMRKMPLTQMVYLFQKTEEE